MSPDQLADLPDSTCAQVIHPKSEICSNKWLPTANKRNGKKQKEIDGILFTTKFTVNKVNLFTLQYHSPNFPFIFTGESMGKYMEIGAPRNSSVEYQSSLNDMPGNRTEKGQETHMAQSNSKNKVIIENVGANIQTEPNTQTPDLISSIARNTETNQAVRITDIHGSLSEMPDGNDKNYDSHVNMMPHGLGLKRLKTTGASTKDHDERNIPRRSDLSAFTRCKKHNISVITRL
jgi:pseudo-response regulator 7